MYAFSLITWVSEQVLCEGLTERKHAENNDESAQDGVCQMRHSDLEWVEGHDGSVHVVGRIQKDNREMQCKSGKNDFGTFRTVTMQTKRFQVFQAPDGCLEDR